MSERDSAEILESMGFKARWDGGWECCYWGACWGARGSIEERWGSRMVEVVVLGALWFWLRVVCEW